MLFSQDKDKENKAPKRSLWGTLFNPRFGDDIKPLAETSRMFANLVAMVLATNNLFPKDHPALRDATVRLSLSEVIAIAWSRLSFTKEGLPQIVLFAAVIGCMVFSALFIITLIFSFFITPAHAAESSSMFTPADGGAGDWAQNWLNYIFSGEPYSLNLEEYSNVPKSCVWQSALGKALGFYSGGILVLAGIILLYHLFSMVAETAHSGKVMGNANQIWAPIRLVVAIGLLVPIGSASAGTNCSISGLNTGQYLVVQVAKWGSGLASNVWKVFTEAVGETTPPSDCQKGSGSPSCIQVPASVKKPAVGIISNYFCAAMYNRYMSELGLKDYFIEAATDVSAGDHFFGPKSTLGPNGFNFTARKLCGGYSLPALPADSLYRSVYETQRAALGSYLTKAKEKVNTYVTYYVPGGVVPHDINEEIKELTESFREDADNRVQSILPAADKQAKEMDPMLSNKLVKDGGWLMAGAWFNSIAKNQADRSASVQNAMPLVLEKSLTTLVEEKFSFSREKKKGISSPEERTLAAVRKFEEDIGFLGDAPVKASTEKTAEQGKKSDDSAWDTLKQIIKSANPAQGLVNLLVKMLTDYNISNTKGLALRFNSFANPLAEVAAFGHSLVNLSLDLFGLALAAYAVGLLLSGAGLVGGLLATIALPFFTAGAFLGFLLPLVPFFRFFFGALTWIIGLFEAVVAVPLWALAHMNPEGAGLPGGMAKSGYFFILNTMLRPVLMIFGLIAGYLLFLVSLSFLNTAFSMAAQTTGSLNGSTRNLATLVFTFMYCGTVYTLGNQCFKSIGMFPEHALRWLGTSGHQEKMGDPSMSQQTMGAVGSYVLGQGIGQLGGAAKQLGDNLRGKKKAAADQRASALADQRRDGIARQRHDDNMRAQGMRMVTDNEGNPVLGDGGAPTYERDPNAIQQASGGEQIQSGGDGGGQSIASSSPPPPPIPKGFQKSESSDLVIPSTLATEQKTAKNEQPAVKEEAAAAEAKRKNDEQSAEKSLADMRAEHARKSWET